MIEWGKVRVISDEELAENARQDAEMLAAQCRCELAGSKPYLLEIEENRVTGLTCTECGKGVPLEWLEDALYTTEDVPVTVAWRKEPDGYWGDDPGAFYGEISPRPAPEPDAEAGHDPSDCGSCDEQADVRRDMDLADRLIGGKR